MPWKIYIIRSQEENLNLNWDSNIGRPDPIIIFFKCSCVSSICDNNFSNNNNNNVDINIKGTEHFFSRLSLRTFNIGFKVLRKHVAARIVEQHVARTRGQI